MPAPDGIALARQVRASALNRTTPIAMITGESDRQLITKVFEAGATFVLFKPIDASSDASTSSKRGRNSTRVKAVSTGEGYLQGFHAEGSRAICGPHART